MGQLSTHLKRSCLAAGVLLSLAALPASGAPMLKVEQTDASKYPLLKAYVSVVNVAGAPFTGLTKDQFQVYELKTNEVAPKSVKSLDASGEGMAIALVLQNSGSMTPVMDDIKKAAAGFISSLGDKAQVAVIAYSGTPTVLAPMGPASQAAGVVGQMANPGQQALLFDGVAAALQQFTGAALPKARAVVVFSDGRDDGSSADPGRLVSDARSKHLPIFVVGHSELSSSGFPDGDSLQSLQQLATGTAGAFAYLQASSGQDLNRAFNQVLQFLTKEYVVQWKADDLSGDGKVHPIDVAISVGDTTLRGGGEIKMPKVKSYTLFIVLGIVLIVLIAAGVFIWWWTRPEPVPEVRCPVCSQVQMPDWDVCLFCLKVAKATLKSTKGATAGKVYPLVGKTVKIGRGQENAIKLPDPAVGSNHCGVQVDGTKFEIIDLGSKNGTFVNGKRVTRRFLRNGDILSLGQSELKFESKVVDQEIGDYTSEEA